MVSTNQELCQQCLHALMTHESASSLKGVTAFTKALHVPQATSVAVDAHAHVHTFEATGA
jgi:hypothetical protein